MKILVINCGSSSVKYQLMDMENEKVLAKGLADRIGIEGSMLTHKVNGKKYIIEEPMEDHTKAIGMVLDALLSKEHGVIKSMEEITAVGHRVVHGGEKYAESVLIDEEVMKSIKDCIKLAPLHNPASIAGIDACKKLMPKVPMVVVFDTAFHQTLPDYAYMYPLPYDLYKKHGIRKYGFHGTSHKYVSKAAAEFLNKDLASLKIITCHLGNGASLAAIEYGKSIDTSMGFTPLAGIAMGTRSGDIDPAIVTYLIRNLKMSADEVDTLLNKKSGIYGLYGKSSDMRDVKKAGFYEHEERAMLALNVFNYRIKQYIGSYIASMNGLDAIVFTGGIGENSFENRNGICENMDYLGIKIDQDKNNNAVGVSADISAEDSKIKILVIPTDEELMIARDTKNIVLALN